MTRNPPGRFHAPDQQSRLARGRVRSDLTEEGNQFMHRPTNPRDKAGRVLYEERMRMLPGLVQPPALDWEELDESTRERWRGHAEGSGLGKGATAVTRDKGDSGLHTAGHSAARLEQDDLSTKPETGGTLGDTPNEPWR